VSAKADDPLEQQLGALRREYLADSAQRVTELRQGRARLAEGERAALPDLRQAFHRLAGSGGSYGFPLVSICSREGEQLVQALIAAGKTAEAADFRALDVCIERIAAAFEEARRHLDGADGATM
jgi:chemotaxis protein histidine kinase CheA